MYKIEISVVDNIAKVVSRPKRITAGTVGLPVHFTFDEHWNGLHKTAVFSAGSAEEIVDGISNTVIVPSKVLKKADEYLLIGVHGLNADGSISTPTIWANVGYIELGVDIDGSADDGTSLPVWKQILDKAEHAEDVAESAEKEAKDLKDYLDRINVQPINIPLARFNLTHNMLNVSSDMVMPDGTPWNFTRNPLDAGYRPGLFTALEQVHALYDDLCDKYEHLWSRYDAADWVGMEYPTYANGIDNSNNLFDRDKVLFDFLYEKVMVDGKEVSRKRPGTEIYVDWLSGQVDIITGESAPKHTISASNRKKMMWLKAGVYVLSYGYELESGKSCTLRVAYVNEKAEGLDTYSYTLIDGDMSGDETKRWYAFELKDDSYCTIMRSTIDVKATIYDIMLEKMKDGTPVDEAAPSTYEHYGKVAYKYPLTEDVVCKEWESADAKGADLRIHTYKPTPQYRTYLYKFSFENNSMHAKPGLANEKKKIFLTSSVNGDERTAPFNSYLFCKRLCEVFAEKTEDGDYYYDDDYFKFAQAFDVYIVPCVNGHGLYHNLRWNANGVQIDRNFNTGYWVAADRKNGGVTFVPETQDYPGVAPDSEFETRLIEKLTEKIKPDMAIDLHNYTSTLPRQFYTGVAWKKWMPLLYQSCVDCSIAFKKHFPQYFGTGIDLVRDSRDYRLEYEALNGEVTTWWRTKGNVYFPALIEVCQTINYNNGELVGTWDNGKYNSTSTAGLDLQGKNTFSVAEYTIRIQMERYGQFVMENQPKE